MELTNKRNKFAAVIIISLCILLAIYLAASIYFMKHLYFGSKINGMDVSGKTVEEIKAQMTSELNRYTLTIKERGGKDEKLKASDINLMYKSDKQLRNFKDNQNPLKWGLSIFNSKNYNLTSDISYDKDLLTKQVENLACLAESNITQPKEPIIKYENNTYVIIDEIKGTKIDKDVLLKRVTDAVSKKESTLDLESANCYINPKYNSKSQNVIKAKDMLTKYASTKVTYTFGNDTETLSGSKISKWLSYDSNFNVTLDEAKVKQYVLNLAYTYNTAGKTRNFKSSSGNIISVGGGDYGWSINTYTESQKLIDTIKAGQTITKEPAYNQKAVSHDSNDIGNTYVEVDMTKQHLWFYKNGSLVVEGDVVTGNVSANHTTPGGIYRLKAKERNATLKGQDYSSPVSYWMPFNEGIGIHDATWRTEFGKQIYLTQGSHGCVNAPFNVAETIFENIEVGTPIVCYY